MMFMAPRVTSRALSPVKITHATYKMEGVWSVNLGNMVITVIYRVPSTVMTTRVTCILEHALHVNLVGLD